MAIVAACASVLLWLGIVGVQIVSAGRATQPVKSDVAIVLGAAVFGSRPSPVFEERIKHGIALYRSGKVRKLLFTGGYGEGSGSAESLVAARFAVQNGVEPEAVLVETISRTTQDNLRQAKAIMRANGLRTALIVSDPLHLRRALRMAADMDIRANAAPTPSSRYRSWRTRGSFLLREIYFYDHYLVTGR
jgi:uncharacterized SAM-binding protein YcdF (DUF218 family)